MVKYMDEHRGEMRIIPAREVQESCVPLLPIEGADPDDPDVPKHKYKISRWSVARRLHADELRARTPAGKEPYDAAELALRDAYAKANQHRTKDEWGKVVFTDEVQLIFARDATLQRILGSRVYFVYRRPGERYHKDCVKPRHVKGYKDGTHLKFFVAVVDGQVAICEECTPYKRLSKSKKKQLDQHCYAAYLGDMAKGARDVLGVQRDEPVTVVQDNWRVHNAPTARAAERKYRLTVIPNQPVRSPDLNPIENVFAMLARRLSIMYLEDDKQHVDADEFCSDVLLALYSLESEGVIRTICRSMPERCAAVIAASGGPTKY